MCTEDKFLKDMALDLERANEIDRDLDYYNLSVEKGSFVRKWFIENHSNLKNGHGIRRCSKLIS